MTPEQQAFYRARTAGRKPLNHAQQLCQGPCKQRRSIGQFANGDDWCIKCRRRAS